MPIVKNDHGLLQYPNLIDDLFVEFCSHIANFRIEINKYLKKNPHIVPNTFFLPDPSVDMKDIIINILPNPTNPRVYPMFDIDTFLKKIRKIWRIGTEAEERIKDCEYNGEWINNVARTIFRSIYPNRNGCDQNIIDDIIKRINDIIQNAAKDTKIYPSGEYYPKDKHIDLYHNVIHRGGIIKDEYPGTVFHELFHAYHHLCCEKAAQPNTHNEFYSRHDCTADVVVESLAAYFESLYDKQYDYSAWYINSPSNYPYAGARYIKNKGENTFTEIFCVSLADFDDALRKLLKTVWDRFWLDEFYSIKNKARVIIKKPRQHNSNKKVASNAANQTTTQNSGSTLDKIILNAFESYLKQNRHTAGTVRSYKSHVRATAKNQGISISSLCGKLDNIFIKKAGKKGSALRKFKEFYQNHSGNNTPTP